MYIYIHMYVYEYIYMYIYRYIYMFLKHATIDTPYQTYPKMTIVHSEAQLTPALFYPMNTAIDISTIHPNVNQTVSQHKSTLVS